VIVMENHGYGQIVGNASAPYLNRFARRGTLFTRMRALGHPSLPNYLALTSGSTLGCSSDACPPRSYRADNVFHQLQAAGKRWRAFEESMPGRCVLHDAGRYLVRHDRRRTTGTCSHAGARAATGPSRARSRRGSRP
jgi:hypothetical protein